MPAAARRAAITLNGESLKIKVGTAKIVVGGLSGEPVVSDAGDVDTSYEPKPCMVEATIILTPGHNGNTLRTLQDAVGTYTWLDTGASYALTNMTASGGGEWEESPDGMPVKFHGRAQPA
jgi:hypothetical protein